MLKDKICSERMEFRNTKEEDLSTVMSMEKDNSQFVYIWSKEQHMETMNNPEKLHLVYRAQTSSTYPRLYYTRWGEIS